MGRAANLARTAPHRISFQALIRRGARWHALFHLCSHPSVRHAKRRKHATHTTRTTAEGGGAAIKARSKTPTKAASSLVEVPNECRGAVAPLFRRTTALIVSRKLRAAGPGLEEGRLPHDRKRPAVPAVTRPARHHTTQLQQPQSMALTKQRNRWKNKKKRWGDGEKERGMGEGRTESCVEIGGANPGTVHIIGLRCGFGSSARSIPGALPSNEQAPSLGIDVDVGACGHVHLRSAFVHGWERLNRPLLHHHACAGIKVPSIPFAHRLLGRGAGNGKQAFWAI